MTAIFEFQYLDKQSKEKLKKAKFSEKGSKRLCFHEEKDSDLHVMLIELKENTVYKAHSHQKNEMIFLQHGDIEITFSDEIVTLKMEDKRLIIIEKGREHSVRAGNKGATILEVIAHK